MRRELSEGRETWEEVQGEGRERGEEGQGKKTYTLSRRYR